MVERARSCCGARSVGDRAHASNPSRSGLEKSSTQGEVPVMTSGQGVCSAKDYVLAVVESYLAIPETPLKPRRDDRYVALELYRRGVTLLEVKGALLLGCARRVFREVRDECDWPLEPIRSLRYFVPVIEEIRHQPVALDPGYIRYLRDKLAPVLSEKAQLRQQASPRVARASGARSSACQLRLPW